MLRRCRALLLFVNLLVDLLAILHFEEESELNESSQQPCSVWRV